MNWNKEILLEELPEINNWTLDVLIGPGYMEGYA